MEENRETVKQQIDEEVTREMVHSETDELTEETVDTETVAGKTADKETVDTEVSESETEDAAEETTEAGGEPEETDTETEADTEEPKRKGLFGKRKKDKRDTQIEELTDRVHRQMAEFDNFRKRSEKEKAAMFDMGAKSVIEKILPAIDNFERGFAGMDDAQKEDPFVQGMEKVYRQMLTTLESIGVTPIEAEGKAFDPNFHNAVMHVEDDSAGENIVVEEFQKGYLYRDSVVRHSMVKVAN